MYHLEVPGFDLELMMKAPAEGRLQLREIGQSASQQLRELQVDAVVCQGSSMVPFLETTRPIALWHDSTWQTLLRMATDEFQFCYPLLAEWDRRVVEGCDLIAFASDWVRDATLSEYDVDAAKVVVLPFGASLHSESKDVVEAYIDARQPPRPCQLTFIGVDWVSKGLPIAQSVTSELNRRGTPTVLNAIGCSFGRADEAAPGWDNARPFDENDVRQVRLRSDPRVTAWGFLGKDRASEYRTFVRILRDSHFLIHPAEFESFGVALVDANALGVPVIAGNSYGPRTIVREGANGHLFELPDFVEEAVEVIQSRMETWQLYRTEARAAFAEYQDRLNWSSNSSLLLDHLARAI